MELDFSQFGDVVETSPRPTIRPREDNPESFGGLPKRGDTGPEVFKLQQALADFGVTSIKTVDGAFGINTEKGIQEYQAMVGLPATGIFDQSTQKSLFETPVSFDEENKLTPTPVAEALDFSAFGEVVEEPTPTQETVVGDIKETAAEQLKLHEGYRPYPYRDSEGFWTIGIGHLIGDGSSKGEFAQYSEDNPMPEEEVQRLFEEDYEKHARIAEQYPAYETMNEKGRLALIDMTFNMGDLRRGWENTLQLLSEGKYEEAATIIENSKYAEQVGDRAKTIASQIRQAGE